MRHQTSYAVFLFLLLQPSGDCSSYLTTKTSDGRKAEKRRFQRAQNSVFSSRGFQKWLKSYQNWTGGKRKTAVTEISTSGNRQHQNEPETWGPWAVFLLSDANMMMIWPHISDIFSHF